MERRIWLWIAVGVLFIVVLFLVFKAGAGGLVGNTIQTAGSTARSAASAASSSGMVGGC